MYVERWPIISTIFQLPNYRKCFLKCYAIKLFETNMCGHLDYDLVLIRRQKQTISIHGYWQGHILRLNFGPSFGTVEGSLFLIENEFKSADKNFILYIQLNRFT